MSGKHPHSDDVLLKSFDECVSVGISSSTEHGGSAAFLCKMSSVENVKRSKEEHKQAELFH